MVMFDYVKRWSADRDPNCVNYKEFSLVPTLRLAMGKDAFVWATMNSTIKFKRESPTVRKFFVGANSSVLDAKDIENYLNLTKRLSWTKFDTYQKCKEKIWVVNFIDNNWKSSICNCPVGKKEFIC